MDQQMIDHFRQFDSNNPRKFNLVVRNASGATASYPFHHFKNLLDMIRLLDDDIRSGAVLNYAVYEMKRIEFKTV